VRVLRDDDGAADGNSVDVAREAIVPVVGVSRRDECGEQTQYDRRTPAKKLGFLEHLLLVAVG
jgi:hypothetical protein